MNEIYRAKGIKLIKGDCLEIMKNIPRGKIDMILCDLPYGTTACKWDNVIPFEPLWEQYKRIIKDNGAIVLFGQEPFSSYLRLSNINNYRYDWIWEKSNPSNIALANKQPMRYHELISVFYKKQPIYNKQMIPRESPRIKQAHKNNYVFHNSQSEQTALGHIEIDSKKYDADFKNPSSIIKIPSLRPNSKEFVKHPTQKPVALLEYLIKTYTNEGELVLDNCMGSGSTGVAAINTNRKFIGIELEQNYFDIAKNRIIETINRKEG
jgi:DNA modification methylase